MLSLYYRPSCPFCQRVLQIADNLKVEFDLNDISEDEKVLTELLEKGGKKQVPFLVDTEKDVMMYESNDIIEYIRKNYAESEDGDIKIVKPKVHVGGSVCESCEG